MSYRIDQDGTIIRDNNPERESGSGNSTWIAILVLLLLTAIGFAIGFGVKKNELENRNLYLQRELSHMEENYAGLERAKTAIRRDLDKYVSRYSPIIIEDIEVGNGRDDGTMETDFGKSINSYRTMYLKPRIKYVGYKSESITLKVKLYNAYGNLSTGNSSPSGYSYFSDMYVYEGENTMTLSGWGSSSRGHWPSGKYRYEIWYGDVCLAIRSFTIY